MTCVTVDVTAVWDSVRLVYENVVICGRHKKFKVLLPVFDVSIALPHHMVQVKRRGTAVLRTLAR